MPIRAYSLLSGSFSATDNTMGSMAMKYLEMGFDDAKLGCNKTMEVVIVLQKSPSLKIIKNKNVKLTFYNFHFVEM